MKQFITLAVLSSLLFTAISFTCTDDGDSDRDIRFSETKYSYCYDVATIECNYGTFISEVSHTCSLLSVIVDDHSLVTSDYLGSERCGCIDALFGRLVIIVDANPAVVTDSQWRYRIINSLDWFYHGVTSQRLDGSDFDIIFFFLHGSTYFQTSMEEIYNVFSGDELTSNPWKAYASTEATTNPCDAINSAIDLLNEVPLSYQTRRRLFYWGFSTPDLTSCVTSGRSFKDISTYAVRQTLSVNLDAIESTYGSFSQCNWYQATSDSNVVASQSIQNRAIIGTLSDFLCLIDETPLPTASPTLSPSASPTLSPSASPTLSPTSPILTSSLPDTITAPPSTTSKPIWRSTTSKPTTSKPIWPATTTSKPTTSKPIWPATTTSKPTSKPIWPATTTSKPTWKSTTSPPASKPIWSSGTSSSLLYKTLGLDSSSSSSSSSSNNNYKSNIDNIDDTSDSDDSSNGANFNSESNNNDEDFNGESNNNGENFNSERNNNGETFNSESNDNNENIRPAYQ